MAPSRIVETVDVLKDGGCCLMPWWPTLSPKHFGLQALEKSLDHGATACRQLSPEYGT